MSFHGPWRIASNPSTDWLTPIVRTGRCAPSRRLRRLRLSSALFSGSRAPDDFRERRDEVGLLHQLIAAASRRDHARPADQERHAMPALPNITLIAAKWPAGKMPLALEFSDPDVRRAAVVAGEDNKRIFRGVAPLDGRQDLSHDGVRLHDKIGVGIQAALVLPGIADRQGRVRAVRGR